MSGSSRNSVTGEIAEPVMYIAAVKLPPGKLASQVAHAAVECFRAGNKTRRWQARRRWLLSPAKIVLRLDDQSVFDEIAEAANQLRAPVAIISDEGRTVVEPGTRTAIAVGPLFRDEVGPWSRLKLY